MYNGQGGIIDINSSSFLWFFFYVRLNLFLAERVLLGMMIYVHELKLITINAFKVTFQIMSHSVNFQTKHP